MKVLIIFTIVMLASCSRVPAPQSVCNVAREPDRFVGEPLTISGMAKMSLHGSTLSDPACPELLLGLEGSDNAFFNSLASTLAPGTEPIRATVTGQVIHESGLPAYTFHVKAGTVQ